MRRIGVDPAEAAKAPDIHSLLKQAAGGLKGILDAMRFSSDSAVESFLEKYDSIPERDRKSLTWQAIALAADVSPEHLAGAALLALQHYSANASKLIVLSNHPDLVRKRVEFAKLPGGHRDRDAVDLAVGMLPSPKGPTFIGHVTVAQTGETEASADIEDAFPAVGELQEKLLPIRRHLLEGK